MITPPKLHHGLGHDPPALLLSQGLSLKAIAAQVGFSHANRLAAAFERRFGVPPRVFRAMHPDA